MISNIVLLCGAMSLVRTHPPIHANIHESVVNLVNDLDSKLTSNPTLKITKALADLTVDAGDHVTLRCEALTTPSAVIYWERNGVRVQGDKEMNVREKMLNIGSSIVESGIVASILSIPCVQTHDSGEYSCIAFNGHQTATTSAELLVEGSSKCKSHRRSPPKINLWTDSRFEMEGNSATLLCRSSEFVDRVWTYDDNVITSDGERFIIEANGDLLIKDITWSDMGTYACTATNEHGEDKVDTFLYPTKKKTF